MNTRPKRDKIKYSNYKGNMKTGPRGRKNRNENTEKAVRPPFL